MEEKKKKDDENKWTKRFPWIAGATVFIFVLFTWIITPRIIEYLISFKYNWELYSRFGDAFGVANALFSGITIALLVIGVLLQRREIQLQRDELRDTRKVMKEQEEQFEIQSKTLRLQQFENTFFNMLKLHNDIVDGISIPAFRYIENDHGSRRVKEVTLKGRECFSQLFSSFRDHYENSKEENILDKIQNGYMNFHKQYEKNLGIYFRNLYQIFKFIDSSSIQNKKFYTNIIRAQLSLFELDILFYNCLSRFGSLKFRPLIEKFAIFKWIYKEGFIERHLDLYNPTAYGK